ncbi:hypothetical protein QBC36DRAFT_315684 [Triangularia setosa]|uniref:Uncharacterized protein n=1 Tax=Triangularia setosa TaxID=2587417 RepID=A0AAN6VXK4_9PEZI|nr:hypothetical protein QBC36DRAFT_315684 [Podospora setosa]
MVSPLEALGGKFPPSINGSACQFRRRSAQEKPGAISFTNDDEIASMVPTYLWAFAIILWLKYEQPETITVNLSVEHARALKVETLKFNSQKGKAQPLPNRSQGVKNSVALDRLRDLADVQIGIMAWNKVIDAHHDNAEFAPNGQERIFEPFPTFAERFDAAIEALRISKSLVNMLPEQDVTRSIVAATKKELSNRVANYQLNSNRSALHTAANQAMENGQLARPQAPKHQQIEPLC